MRNAMYVCDKFLKCEAKSDVENKTKMIISNVRVSDIKPDSKSALKVSIVLPFQSRLVQIVVSDLFEFLANICID